MSTTHPTEALYTLCPLPIASNIAVELGWLDEEFQRVGARARYLRSLPDNQGWLPHFRHSRDDLIRELSTRYATEEHVVAHVVSVCAWSDR